MATCVYKEIDKIKFRGILMEYVWIHLIENGINYYILIVYTLAYKITYIKIMKVIQNI